MRAYNIKLSLRDFWNFKDPLLAEDYLKRWYFWATHSRLNPVIDTAKAIKGHWKGVLNYINTRIDNGVLEPAFRINAPIRSIFRNRALIVE